MGYQFFGGKFYRCIDGQMKKYDAAVIPDKITCLANATLNNTNRWVNSKIHFNSAFTGFLALFQVVSFVYTIQRPDAQRVVFSMYLEFIYVFFYFPGDT